jgi:exodeoxyribonuclease V alpha subunit
LIDQSGETVQVMPDNAFTLHRLLGVLPHSSTFMHCAQNLLPYHVVIVDEASMVDMVMMASLFDALPLQTRVILLGDKDQLSSVEAGAVFSDICGAAAANNALHNRMVHLTKSNRFSQDSGIGRLAYCVNNGMVDEAWDLVCNKNSEGIVYKKLPDAPDFAAMIGEKVAQHFEAYSGYNNFTDAFAEFERFRVLCGLRHGKFGVFAVNLIVEKMLAAKGLIPPDAEWYHGKPVMITRNTGAMDLYNGDTGIVMWKPDNSFEVCFTGNDPMLTRSFYPLRIPLHETVYATTVHKSQGSEFEIVLLVLPDADSPVLTRELLYTAITRAKKSIEIWCTESSFKNAVAKRTMRMSGLSDALSVNHYTN